MPGPAALSRPHRWFAGAGAAAVVAWVLGATVSAGHAGAWSSGPDPCARPPGTAVTHLPDGASAWAGDDGWLCLSLDGSVATVPPTAPAGPMLSLESARGTVHVGVLRAGQASTVALPDGTRAAVHAVRVDGSPLRVWSVREPSAG
ncbi:MAG: hypothetical protein U0Q15_11575 [Kineosporiaceae bacterium]